MNDEEWQRPNVSPRAMAIVTNTFAERRDVLRSIYDNAIGRHKDLVRQQIVELDTLRRLVLDNMIKESH